MALEGTPGRVVVTSRSFGSGEEDPAGLLEREGLEVVRADTKHDPEKLRRPLATALAWIAGTAPVDEERLALAPRLLVLARYGAGVDSVDLRATSRRGVEVTNTPGANAEAVADHTVGLMLTALRHTREGDAAVRGGEHPALRGRELGRLTVGILGFGGVGRAVTRRLVGGFGSRVLVHDPHVERGIVEVAGAEWMQFWEMIEQAQVLSLHRPGGGEPLVDEQLLERLPPAAVLVNTARGDLVDETAVAGALSSGRLSAGAFDVLASEPATGSPLFSAPNTTFTPHIASQTAEAVDRMGLVAAGEVIKVLSGDEPSNPVGQVRQSLADK